MQQMSVVHTTPSAGTPEWPHPVTNDAEGKHNPRINPSAPSDHPIFGKLDNVRFSARKSFVIGTHPTCKYMAMENMTLCGQKCEEMEMELHEHEDLS